MSYNGYENWETWTIALHYDEFLHDAALAYMEMGKDYTQFLQWIPQEIYSMVLNDFRQPCGRSVGVEFVFRGLGKVDYEHLCSNAWEEAEHTFMSE